jgi:colanic acid/amylovoran biosynthesis glycosyltransferase
LVAFENTIVRIAYFTNQYPAVSHTFIRREIRAVEALGLAVVRYALRPGENLVDPDDQQEQQHTRYILNIGTGEMIRCLVSTLLTQPAAMTQAVVQAIKMGWRSNRGIPRHLFYLIEATVLASWCRQDAVNHLHVHFGTNPAVVALLASLFSRIPFSFTAHGPDEFQNAAYLSLDTKIRHAAFAVCVSSFGRSQLMLWSDYHQWTKIAVVGCGLDKKFLEGTQLTTSAVPQLVCVGRLCSEKAQLLLVAATRRLRDAGIPCKIVLVGDGPIRPQIEEAIGNAGLQGEMTITGWLSNGEVRAEILAARALVLPSFSENLPVVIMEAMALYRPVVSTYVAGIPELIQPGVTGWLVPPGDEVALAAAMREALEAPVERLAAMGSASHLRVAERHDAIKEATKLMDLFVRHAPNSAKDASR